MKPVLADQRTRLCSATSLAFGCCPAFVFVDIETPEHEGIANTGAGGAVSSALRRITGRKSDV